MAEYSRSRKDSPGKLVLIVEDESYLCELIADILSAEGHYIVAAPNGLAALERLREFTPDIILLDLMMPIMDGWEVMSVLGSDPRLSQIPVVIITAIYDVTVTEQSTNAKAILAKPFDIERLTEVVRTFAA
jgi:CheY-like chemotaxis protein